jgi:hypothetical protein
LGRGQISKVGKLISFPRSASERTMLPALLMVVRQSLALVGYEAEHRSQGLGQRTT